MIKNIKTQYSGLNIELQNLKFINYIVGKNGSGKSRIIEMLQERFDLKENEVNRFEYLTSTEIKFENKISLIYAAKPESMSEFYLSGLMNPNGKPAPNVSKTDIELKKCRELKIDAPVFKIILDVLDLQEYELAYSDEGFVIITGNQNSLNKLGKHSSHKHSQGRVYLTNQFIRMIWLINAQCNLHANEPNHSVAFFTEEPEAFLHPSIHKKLPEIYELIVQYVAESFQKKIQLFITTHSPFLISAACKGHLNHEHKIYHLGNGECINEFSRTNLIEESGKPFDMVLSDLGFEMKDIYYTNCLIYVEGPVDVLYINYWLNKYIEENHLEIKHKGVDFDFIEYGGSLAAHLTLRFNDDELDEPLNLNELVNIFSLNRRIFFITDDDGNKKAFENAKKRISISIKEIDNGSVFYRDAEIETIECYLTTKTKISKDQNKVQAAIVNLKYWRKNNLGLNSFHSNVNTLCKKLYEFIQSSN